MISIGRVHNCVAPQSNIESEAGLACWSLNCAVPVGLDFVADYWIQLNYYGVKISKTQSSHQDNSSCLINAKNLVIRKTAVIVTLN